MLHGADTSAVLAHCQGSALCSGRPSTLPHTPRPAGWPQAFKYDSVYAQPFATLQKALDSSNQCDTIHLAGGAVHAGPIYINKPNVTIETGGDWGRAAARTHCASFCDVLGAGVCLVPPLCCLRARRVC